MPEWLKAIGLCGLVIIGLTGLGVISGIVMVWISNFWDAARKGNQKVKPVAEFITGLSYLVSFWFLVFACWYETRFLWRYNQPVFWSVVIAVTILASKWWLTHGKYAERQEDKSFYNLIHEDKSSSFYSVPSNEKHKLAEKIKNDFANGLKTYGSSIPLSSLQYSVEDIKRAFKVLSTEENCDDEYRATLRECFGYISNTYSDSDATLMRSIRPGGGLLELPEQQRNRFHFLLQRSNIRSNILDYEWDEWMLENGIKQALSADDIKRQADAIDLTVDDLRDISPGHVPTREELISNREKRANNLPSA